MVVQATENPSKCGAQKAKAKSSRARLIGKLARFVRKEGLSYNDWRYVARRVSPEVRTPSRRPNPSGSPGF